MTFIYDSDLALSAAAASAGTAVRPAGIGEVTDAAWDFIKLEGRTFSRSANLFDAYQPLIDALNEGAAPEARFANPYGATPPDPQRGGAWRRAPLAQREQAIWDEIDVRRVADPGFLPEVPKDRAAFHDFVLADVRRQIGEAERTLARPRSFAGDVAAFAGMAASAMADPVNIASLFVGAPAAAGILRTALIEGLVNTAAEGLTLPQRMEYARELKRPFGPGQAAAELGLAFAGGAVLGGGIKAVATAIPAIRGRAQDVMQMGDRALASAARALPGASSELRGAAAALEREADIQEAAPDLAALEKATGYAEHRARLQAGADAIEAGGAPAIPDRPEVAGGPPKGLPPGAALERFRAADLTVDAATFQFKRGGDARGVTEALLGVETWDPIRAGVIVVWERADGTRFVADGHQRVGLARRLEAEGQDAPLTGWVLRERDGVTAEEARTIAALKNIGEGTGSPLDAARVLQADPSRLGGLPPRNPLVRLARDLIRLSDDAFGMVDNGVVAPDQAALVGRLVEDPDLHATILALVAKVQPENATQAQAVIRLGLAAGTKREIQLTLFGEEMIVTSLFRERAQVVDAVTRRLKRDRQTFRRLVENRQRIEAEGNVLDADRNAMEAEINAQALDTFQRLAARTGSIGDAVRAAAERLSRSDRSGIDDVVAAVRSAVERGDFDGAAAGGSGRAAEVADEGGPIAPDAAAGAGRVEPETPSDAAEEAELALFAERGGDGPKAQAEALEQEIRGEAAGDQAAGMPKRESTSGEASGANIRSPIVTKSQSTQPSRFQATTLAPPSGVFSSRAIVSPTLRGSNIEIGSINPSSGKNVYHALDNFNELQGAAKELQPELDRFLGEIAARVPGARFAGSRVKEADALQSKLSFGRQPFEISDYLGGRIVVQDPAALAAARAALEREARIVETDDFLDKPKGGYRAVHVQVLTTRGVSVEVQIIPREIMDALQVAHPIYARWRRRAARREEMAEMAGDLAEARRIFDEGWAAFQARADGSGVPGRAVAGDRAAASDGSARLDLTPPETAPLPPGLRFGTGPGLLGRPGVGRTVTVRNERNEIVAVGEYVETVEGAYRGAIIPGADPVSPALRAALEAELRRRAHPAWVRFDDAEPAAPSSRPAAPAAAADPRLLEEIPTGLEIDPETGLPVPVTRTRGEIMDELAADDEFGAALDICAAGGRKPDVLN